MHLRKPFFPNRNSEFVIGLVAPLGVDLEDVCKCIKDRLKLFGYTGEYIRLSELVAHVEGLETQVVDEPEYKRILSYMDAGDEIREKTGRGDAMAIYAIQEVASKRGEEEATPRNRVVYLMHSLKHAHEALAFREVYGGGFFLIGVHSSESARIGYLQDDKGMTLKQAKALFKRDEDADEEHGQHTRETFELADAFLDSESGDLKRQVWRILDLLFGRPDITPTRDEYAIYLAYAASLRSGDLSRQVGAVVRSADGDVIAAGANDVPKFGGGQYWEDDGPGDHRDSKRGFDANAQRRDAIFVNVARRLDGRAPLLPVKVWDDPSFETDLARGKQILEGSGIADLTEFGRAVHAEMEALIACARAGVSPRGGTLFSTTFPCHNCAKHLVGAGIRRVVYIEPYPKSQAVKLHSDSIAMASPGETVPRKVSFEPFVGVGPRRFFDLFSVRLGRGRQVERNDKGRLSAFVRKRASIRMNLQPVSYLERELKCAEVLDRIEENSNVAQEE